MPDEKSIFDCIMSLQDTANELLSAKVDDYSEFCDAYLTIQGVDADNDDITKLKKNRVIVLPEGATANWLIKSTNDATVENTLKRIHDSIYRIAQCPDFSSETFVGGVSSGIAIKYRLTGMETRAGKIEAEMKKALQRRIEIISGMTAILMGEDIWRDIQITFTRNIPEDTASIANLINTLKGTVSDATLLGLLPFVDDVQAELDSVNEQKTANMELYGFGNITGADTEEEDEDAADDTDSI
jgi:SPP1 family phage portal protein